MSYLNTELLSTLIERPPEYDAYSDRIPIPTPMMREILARDAHKCRVCNSEKRVKVHHICPQGPSTEDNLIVLCDICHEYVHKQLRNKGYRYYRPR
jgi:hypothetical protein